MWRRSWRCKSGLRGDHPILRSPARDLHNLVAVSATTPALPGQPDRRRGRIDPLPSAGQLAAHTAKRGHIILSWHVDPKCGLDSSRVVVTTMSGSEAAYRSSVLHLCRIDTASSAAAEHFRHLRSMSSSTSVRRWR